MCDAHNALFGKAGRRRFVDRLFEREEISGDGLCPTYFVRWTLLRLFGCAVYLHKFIGDDWSLDYHDHPKRFISIGLRGAYVEHTPNGRSRMYVAPWVRTFPAVHRHRITLTPSRTPCWTLVCVFRAERPWGFWTDNHTWIPWRKYVGSERAKQAKACP